MSLNILLPLDGSAFSEHALPAALDLARRLGARLHVVRVHEPPVPMPADALLVVEAGIGTAIRQQERDYLHSIQDRCGAVLFRAELLEGPVASTLSAYALDARIDLVVMSTHGRSGISRAWVGSVADALVRRTPVPVLLLRPTDGGGQPEAIDCHHVLVPLDGSPLAEGILEPLATFLYQFRPRVTLLRVLAPVQVTTDARGMSFLTQDPHALACARAEAERYLEGCAAPLRSLGFEVGIQVATHSVAAAAILEHAHAAGCDLVAMATHGRGGWSRVAIGSVADKVMRGTLMPVLLYRPPAAQAEPEQRVR